ncbi:hypothetical protein MG293_019745 [Ovis ammon polii]|uniref:Uncharacterized protein n=1 Tax=Ovis ammon polii TaxID=230172 RepID=A0AAD4TP63_OVIAM|nr:hypothetical protein MG293_019745 [Ovis ammon polii]
MSGPSQAPRGEHGKGLEQPGSPSPLPGIHALPPGRGAGPPGRTWAPEVAPPPVLGRGLTEKMAKVNIARDLIRRQIKERGALSSERRYHVTDPFIRRLGLEAELQETERIA